MTLRYILHINRWFFIAYLYALIPVGIFQLIFSPEQLMRWVNTHNSPAADVFFTYATYLGDGNFMLFLIAVSLIWSRRIAIIGAVSFAITGLLTIFLKQVVFADALRPLKYFEHALWKPRLVEGLDIHSFNSFPSGHSMSAFALFTLLALIDKRKSRGWLWAVLAIIAAYSRVYLFQHFVIDVWVGSLIGTAVSVISYQMLMNSKQ